MEICGSEVGCTNIAYPELVLKLLPTGKLQVTINALRDAVVGFFLSFFFRGESELAYPFRGNDDTPSAFCLGNLRMNFSNDR